ncbi:MAG: MTH938/NDUFAF3 family protein [bacterium]
MIESYSFGRIKISGKIYNSDLIILGAKVISPWWRKEGHRLSCGDIEVVFNFKPDVLIAGQGDPGLMKTGEDVIRKCGEENIEFSARPTRPAVELFNGYFNEGKKVAGCFHLTC